MCLFELKLKARESRRMTSTGGGVIRAATCHADAGTSLDAAMT